MKNILFLFFCSITFFTASAQTIEIKWSGKDACGHSYLYTEVSGTAQPTQIWWTAEYVAEGKVKDGWPKYEIEPYPLFQDGVKYFYYGGHDFNRIVAVFYSDTLPLLAQLAEYTAYTVIEGDTLNTSYLVNWDELPENGNAPLIWHAGSHNDVDRFVHNGREIKLAPANYRWGLADKNLNYTENTYWVNGVQGGYDLVAVSGAGVYNVHTRLTTVTGNTCDYYTNVVVEEVWDTFVYTPYAVDTTVFEDGQFQTGIKVQVLQPENRLYDFWEAQYIPNNGKDTLYPNQISAGFDYRMVENLGYGIYRFYVIDIHGGEEWHSWYYGPTSATKTTQPQIEISLYPNPTTNQITITGDYTSGAIYDLSGREVVSFGNTQQLNISSLPAGNYVARVTDEKGAVGVEKFVKIE